MIRSRRRTRSATSSVDVVIGHADPELLRTRREHRAVDERLRSVRVDGVEGWHQAVDLLLDDLGARTAELFLELGDLGGQLRDQDRARARPRSARSKVVPATAAIGRKCASQ